MISNTKKLVYLLLTTVITKSESYIPSDTLNKYCPKINDICVFKLMIWYAPVCDLIRKINLLYYDLPTKHGWGRRVVKFQNDYGLNHLITKLIHF